MPPDTVQGTLAVRVMSLDHLMQLLGYTFRNRELLSLALTHPSLKNLPSNQRLEFLGDAVLGLVVTELLYTNHPDLPEGELTKLRARLVNRDSLASLAQRLKLGHWLKLSPSEERNNGRARPSNLADAMEAVVGAIYLDADLATAQRCVRALIEPEWQSLRSHTTQALAQHNPKGELQERLQTAGLDAPTYTCTLEEGPAHARNYQVECRWQGRLLGTGSGTSKRLAEFAAARQALAALAEQPALAEN